MRKDKSKLTTLIIVIITIIVVVLSFLFSSKEEKNENNIKIVQNYTNFFTVNSCLSRYITYLASKNTEDLLLVLNDSYKKTNNITKDNVLDYLGNINENTTYKSKKMYYENLSNSVQKYYVYGQISEESIYQETLLEKTNYKDIYYIVYMDFDNKIFSIEPYSGEIFIGGENNE